jgi:hypothetical protein
MEKLPTKSELINAIQEDYQAWDSAVAGLDDDRLVQVKIGEWTIKDIIAHITWHENEMAGLLQAHALVGSPWWDKPTDERNRLIFEQNQSRPLADIRQEARQVHAQLEQLLEALPEADLYDPTSFPDMPSDWKPYDLIAQNTHEHYRDHLQALQARLL